MLKVCHWRCLALCWRHSLKASFLACLLLIVCLLFVHEAPYSFVQQDEPNWRPPSRLLPRSGRTSNLSTTNRASNANWDSNMNRDGNTQDNNTKWDSNTDGDGKRNEGNINWDGNTKDGNTQRDGNRKWSGYLTWNGNYFLVAKRNRNINNTNRDGNTQLGGNTKYGNVQSDGNANRDGKTQKYDYRQSVSDTVPERQKLVPLEKVKWNSAKLRTWKERFKTKRVDASALHIPAGTVRPTATNKPLERVNRQPTYVPFLGIYEPVILEPTDSLRAFKSMMTPEEHQIFLDSIDALSGALDKAQIPYFLYGGTLVGSWRHHGMVPWDDDIDVAVPYDRQEEILQVLKGLAPDFLIKFRPEYALKFFSSKSKKVPSWSWSWPFIDVCFYLENATHVIDPIKYFPDFTFPKEEVFPLRKRPFEGRMLLVPGQTETYLRRTYDLETCLVGHYDHRVERDRAKDEQAGPIDCEPLKKRYPFVERVPVPSGGCNETLVRGGAVLGWYYDQEQTC